MTTASRTGWFVAQLRPHGLVQARRNLLRQGFEVFAPEVLSGSQARGTPQKARKPLFPGYLFVRFNPDQAGWTTINNTRGVSRLILSDPRRPRPLPTALMAGLKARCDTSGLITFIDDFEVGDRIRILSGPFADLVTQIDTLTDKERVGVLINLMGRPIRTSLPRSQIVKMP